MDKRLVRRFFSTHDTLANKTIFILLKLMNWMGKRIQQFKAFLKGSLRDEHNKDTIKNHEAQ
ncbi:unnamed protein product [Malus baccata var. baccata]